MRARRASSRKLGWRAVGTRCARSCAKRSIGRSWVVPWIRTSAMVTLHSVSCSCRSTSSTKVRPGRKLPLKYFTPDSTLPLVWARYGWQTRGSKLQYSAKALKVAFQAKRDGGRAPIDLALLTRGRLEAPERQLAAPLGRAEGTDEELDRLVTPRVTVLTEFLKQDLGGVPDLGGAVPQVGGVRSQPRPRPRRTLVWPPRGLPHAPPDGLPIQSELPGQFRDPHPPVHRQTAQLFPSLPTDHWHLLA